jgi:hypothetical protein
LFEKYMSKNNTNSGNNLKLLIIPLSDSDEDAFRESDMAYGLKIEGQPKMVWFPKSQIRDWTMSAEQVSFWCPIWLITDKGVEDFIDTQYEPGLFD